MKLTWNTERRKISSLIPYKYNPRRLTKEQAVQLSVSLEKFNLVEIPAINTDGVIIAGHQRLAIMKALGRGAEVVDVRVPSRKLTEAELKEYNLRSNKNTGEWDFNVLANDFDEAMLKDVGFDLSTFPEPEIGAVEGQDDVPEMRKTKIKLGDMFGGSGTTLIAAEKTGRRCYMLELNPIYCQVIIDRWEAFTGKKAKAVRLDK